MSEQLTADLIQAVPDFTVGSLWTADGSGCRNGDLRLEVQADDPTRWRVENWRTASPICGGQVPNPGHTDLTFIQVVDHNLGEFGITTDGLDEWCAAVEGGITGAYEAAEEAELVAAKEAALPGRLARDLLNETPEEVDYLVPSLIAPGWTVKMAGREKLGKGTLAQYLIGKLERDEPTCFGPAYGEPVTTVILSEEPPESMAEKQRLFRVEQARVIWGWEFGGLTWHEKADKLVAIALEEGHGFVFVDNISRAAEIEDEAGPELARAVEYLQDRCRAHRLAAWVDHHHKKGGAADEDKSRGSTSIAGALDNNVEMFPEKGSRRSRKRRLTSLGRMRDTRWEKYVELNEAGTDYILCDGPTEESAEDRSENDRLTDRLSLAQGPMTVEQFMSAQGLKEATARRRLKGLVASGDVKKSRPTGSKADVYEAVIAEAPEPPV